MGFTWRDCDHHTIDYYADTTRKMLINQLPDRNHTRNDPFKRLCVSLCGQFMIKLRLWVVTTGSPPHTQRRRWLPLSVVKSVSTVKNLTAVGGAQNVCMGCSCSTCNVYVCLCSSDLPYLYDGDTGTKNNIYLAIRSYPMHQKKQKGNQDIPV